MSRASVQKQQSIEFLNFQSDLNNYCKVFLYGSTNEQFIINPHLVGFDSECWNSR